MHRSKWFWLAVLACLSTGLLTSGPGAGVSGFAGGLGNTAYGYPQPELVPHSWTLDFTYDKPRLIAVPDLLGNVRWYWYMTYKVVNNSNTEQLLIPEASVTTDRGDIVEAGDDVPTNVFSAVKSRVNNDLLESPLQIVGKILRGEDHALESVAIWPAFDHDVDSMTVFMAGLSGETVSVANPLTRKPVVMRRTLMLQFPVPGTGELRGDPLVEDASESWVMR